MKTRRATEMLPLKLVIAKNVRMVRNIIFRVYAMLHARNTFAFFRDIILLIITITWSGSGRENNGQQGHLDALTRLIKETQERQHFKG